MESLLHYWISAWFTHLTVQSKAKINRLIQKAIKNTGVRQHPSLHNIFQQTIIRQAQKNHLRSNSCSSPWISAPPLKQTVQSSPRADTAGSKTPLSPCPLKPSTPPRLQCVYTIVLILLCSTVLSYYVCIFHDDTNGHVQLMSVCICCFLHLHFTVLDVFIGFTADTVKSNANFPLGQWSLSHPNSPRPVKRLMCEKSRLLIQSLLSTHAPLKWPPGLHLYTQTPS